MMTNEETTANAANAVRCKDCRYCRTLNDGVSFDCDAWEMSFYAPRYDAATFCCADGKARARVLEEYEVMTTCGGGWIENWLAPEDGEPECFDMQMCAWCNGYLVTGDGSTTGRDVVAEQYGKKYGMRMWTDRPTDEQREAAKWQA